MNEAIKRWYQRNKKATHYLLAAFFIGVLLGKLLITLVFIGMGVYAVWYIFKKKHYRLLRFKNDSQ